MKVLDRRLLVYARATRLALAVDVALGLAIALLAVAQAGLLGSSIADAFVGGLGVPELAPRLAALAAVMLGRAGCGWAQEAAAYRLAASAKSELRRRLLAHAVSLGPRWRSSARTGDLVTLATRGLDALDAYFARYLPQLILGAIVPVVVVLSLAASDLTAAATVALTVPLIPVFMVLIGRYSEGRRQRRWNALSRLSSWFLDVVAGLPTLRIFGRAAGQYGAIGRMTDEYRTETMSVLRVAFLSAFVLELVATLSVALVAVGVGLRLVVGDLSLSTGLFVLVLAPEAYLPLRQLGAQFHASEEGLSAAARVFEVLEARPETVGASAPAGFGVSGSAATDSTVPPSLKGGELRVERLSVRHRDRDEFAPADISFTVRGGEIVALAGESGAGKSTVLSAILGLLPADEGRVCIVGESGEVADLAFVDTAGWRSRIGYVPQEPFFVDGTIRENVRLIAPHASDSAIATQLDRLGLGDVSLDARLSERGAGLSSGQRRRLAVCRALLRRVELLLLDEPTAGLDDQSERLVLDVVRHAASAGLAVVLVAHRPAALVVADRVISVRSSALDAEEVPALPDSLNRASVSAVQA